MTADRQDSPEDLVMVPSDRPLRIVKIVESVRREQIAALSLVVELSSQLGARAQ
jgi:hypothetical protein